MRKKQLGNSGLYVSEIALGCMTFGEPSRGSHEWTLSEIDSEPLIRQAYEAGITFYDTANSYSDGSSEEILGELLWDMAPRHEVVIGTKVFGGGPDPIRGLSRRAIMTQIDMSLKRLKVDHVDLYQIHRWDQQTPIRETMEALHDVVKAGKARYLGASGMRAWQFAKAQEIARHSGWTPFVSMQNQINLIYREEEREMIPLCRDQGVGLIPWSPIARGLLARPFGTRTLRSNTDKVSDTLYGQTAEADRKVIDVVAAIATKRGASMAQVALAWVRQKDGVTSPIIGVSNSEQLADQINGISLVLTADEIFDLESPYVPHSLAGQN